jgi:hypothetical protein
MTSNAGRESLAELKELIYRQPYHLARTSAD